jgi:hypothetical protein
VCASLKSNQSKTHMDTTVGFCAEGSCKRVSRQMHAPRAQRALPVTRFESRSMSGQVRPSALERKASTLHKQLEPNPLPGSSLAFVSTICEFSFVFCYVSSAIVQLPTLCLHFTREVLVESAPWYDAFGLASALAAGQFGIG